MDFSLCPYKYFFGKPKKGVHSQRFLDLAIVDILLTIAVAYCISEYFKKDFKEVLFALFLLGVILHRILCVRTTIDKILFPDT
jgi:hypothetical protein